MTAVHNHVGPANGAAAATLSANNNNNNNPANATKDQCEHSGKIPAGATANISVRFVPDQQAADLVAVLSAHVEHEFSKRHSPNTLRTRVNKTGDWWLGDVSNALFREAKAAVTEAWGVEPLMVREGGTMPLTSFMEDTFDAPAIHLPMGQSTDSAHLPNERICAHNLHKGKEVVKTLLARLGKSLAKANVPAHGMAKKARR